MNKLKVACIVPSLLTGGAEKMALDLVTYLNKEIFEVVFISLYECSESLYGKLAKERNISVLFLNKKSGLDTKTFISLFKILSKIKPDIIHTHLHASIYCVPWVIFNKSTRWIHTVHNEAAKEMPKLYLKIMKHFYKKNLAVPVAISKIIRTSISHLYGLKEQRIPLIYNGIDTKSFLPAQMHDEEEIILCCVARFSNQKNHNMLIESFNKAYRKFSRITLLLIGDGELRTELENKINYYGISEAVKFIGNTNNVLSYLQKAHIFVLSSKYEGLPLSILEAIAVGLPVIATEVGGIPDIITNGVQGFLVPLGDSDRFSDAILKLVLDRQLRQIMGSKAVEKSKEFDVRRMAYLYGENYQKNS